MEGVVKVYKPILATSTECVEEVKKALGVRKAGHSGTLDPHAEGLLLICLNSSTKLIPYLLNLDKEYIGEAILGIKTNTGDRGGVVIESNLNRKISYDSLLEAIQDFKGKIKQIPPLYSAIKVKGKRLYEYAREGIDDVELVPREVTVYDFDVLYLIDENIQKFGFRIRCSKGTYVRRIIEDLGERLGCGAFLSKLRRIKIGPFDLEDSVKPWDKERLNQAILSNEEVVKKIMPVVEITPEEESKISRGISIKSRFPLEGEVGLFLNKTLVAIAEGKDGVIKPLRVFKT